MVLDALVKFTAIRLVLAIWEGANPKMAKDGVMRIPPPKPKTEPRLPATNPIPNKIKIISNIAQIISIMDSHKILNGFATMD